MLWWNVTLPICFYLYYVWILYQDIRECVIGKSIWVRVDIGGREGERVAFEKVFSKIIFNLACF